MRIINVRMATAIALAVSATACSLCRAEQNILKSEAAMRKDTESMNAEKALALWKKYTYRADDSISMPKRNQVDIVRRLRWECYTTISTQYITCDGLSGKCTDSYTGGCGSYGDRQECSKQVSCERDLVGTTICLYDVVCCPSNIASGSISCDNYYDDEDGNNENYEENSIPSSEPAKLSGGMSSPTSSLSPASSVLGGKQYANATLIVQSLFFFFLAFGLLYTIVKIVGNNDTHSVHVIDH